MKILKKMFAVICSVAMAASMVTGVSAATIDNPLSLNITDNKDNTVTIDVKTSFDAFNSAKISLAIPEAVQAYITGWEWSSALADSGAIDELDQTYGYKTGSNTGLAVYANASLTAKSGTLTTPSNDVIVSLKLTLNGTVPADIANANPITLGGDYKSATKKIGATTINDSEGTLYYLYREDHYVVDKTPANYFTYDPEAVGNYVILPAAEPEPVGPTYDGYVGDDDATDEAIGAIYDFTAPEAGATGVKWTVETNDGVTKTRVSAVDVAGGATYKLGLVIQGLAESAVKSITAVLQ